MNDQLALEPGRPLRELERSILNQDPALELPMRPGGEIATVVSSDDQPSFAAEFY